MKKRYEIYLWGAGNMEAVVRALVLPEVTIKGIVDVQAGRIREKDGLPVLLPQEVGSFDAVVVTAKRPEAIRSMYLELGYPEEKLVLPWLGVQQACRCLDIGKWERLLGALEEQRQRWRAENAPYEAGVDFPRIHSAEELLREVIRQRKSICRFGDGEFEIMRMKNRAWFQTASVALAERLRAAVRETMPGICVCLADNFGSLAQYTEEAADDIRQYMTQPGVRRDVTDFLSRDVVYYDTYVSRPYLIYQDKQHAKRIFSLWKQLFQGRKILLVEGEHACSGKGSDLFFGCADLRRILTSDTEAFAVYDTLLARVRECADRDDLILLRLGPAATVMARDLALEGYQAIDFGQLDNEYDWYRMGAEKRMPIPGKLVAELSRSV